MEIELISFSDKWINEYLEEKKVLVSLFGAEVKAVEHVGSTAIPIDLAKPVIDIFAGVDPFRNHEYYSMLLGEDNYRYTVTGMKGRHLFQKYNGEKWTHNIHIIEYSAEFHHRNEILFRDFIKDKKELMQEYSLLKIVLKISATDIEEYTKGKTAFIQKVVDMARKEKGWPLVSVWE